MSTFIYAQMEGEEPNVPCPTCPVEGDGTLKTPIDEYTIYLIGLAIMLALVYFTINKYKKSLI
ncbi:hypothetical protein [Empedobacter brevis]|uniref:hypothetical protein n=1 Tax=Empedobacter brevis TaxID=247 RepID=UPI002FE02CB0